MAVIIHRGPDGSIRQDREFTGELRIGTDADADFCLPAELRLPPERIVIARSTVFQVPVLLAPRSPAAQARVNGRRVVALKTLRHKDLIQVGDADLEFWELVIRKVTPRSPLVGKRCLVCYRNLQVADDAISCPRCELPYHKHCWFYLETCATYACGYPILDMLKRVLSSAVRFKKLEAESELVKRATTCRAGQARDQGPFKANDYIAYCPKCDTPFHAQCWLALERCPSCGADVDTVIRSVLDPLHQPEAAQEERTA